MSTITHQNQLMEYRLKKQYEYERKIRLENIREKYSQLLIMNKYLLSIIRIQRYLKKYFFHEPLNQSFNEIPGLFRFRCKISQLNMIDFLDEMDDNMIISLMSSLDISEKNEYWIMIDLRIYGKDYNLPIYINDNKYYLSHQQKYMIYSRWIKINPNTRNGLRYSQNLDYQRSCAKDMKFIL